MANPEATSALRLGTRGSRLALAQSGQLARRLEELGHRVELIVIRTSGDKLTDVSLAKVGGKGLFLKEIEEALAAREIDFAVHSLKDVPAELPPGFAIAAIPARAPVHDVLVLAERIDAQGAAGGDAPLSRDDRALAADEVIRALPAKARVGTGSLRRRAQLRALRDDLDVVAMRGNVDTRLAKLEAGATDAIVLAAAGLVRLGLSVQSAALDPCTFLPAPGQGALALEVRADDAAMIARLAALDDRETARACAAERAFLRALGASCQVPVAAYARSAAGADADAETIEIDGLVASLDGGSVLRDRLIGQSRDAESLGRELADRLLARGARALLDAAERDAGRL